MSLHSLALNRIHYMSRTTGTPLSDERLRVLEFAWNYYRRNSVGPLFQNIKKHTGVTRDRLSSLFPAGISSVYTWVGIPIQSRDKGCKPMAVIEVEDPREVYFDHNATTPVRKEVVDAMVGFLQDSSSFGNPSSSYDIGSRAYDVIERAREQVAGGLGVDAAEIYFVGSGSEANNLALRGLAARHARRRRNGGPQGHVVCSRVEHSSILETVRYLGKQGFEITWLDVAADGALSVDQVARAIRRDTVLVTVMAANNEIGTIYPYAEIGSLCSEKEIPFFVDAIQAYGNIPLRPKQMGISMLSMSGHKIGAPKGVAAIYIDGGLTIEPLIHGGSQESGMRAGTENVVGIMALGLAADLACKEMESERLRYLELRNQFLGRLAETIPEAVVNGTMENRLAHNLSVGFPDVDSGSVLLSLNQIGIAVSAGSACSAGANKGSHVLDAIGADSDNFGTIRFGFGKQTVSEDIDYLFAHLPRVLAGLNEHSDAELVAPLEH
jgi:cysteine desulfurase